jgi:hypothetical protein
MYQRHDRQDNVMDIPRLIQALDEQVPDISMGCKRAGCAMDVRDGYEAGL